MHANALPDPAAGLGGAQAPRPTTASDTGSRGMITVQFPSSLLAAYDITRASMAWAPIQHDEDRIRSHFVRFYPLPRRYSDLPFDLDRAAQLELAYWAVYRQLLRQSDQAAFVDTMTRLHSEVFGLPEDQVRLSAERRARGASR